MIFSKDVLFLHVPKTGGMSITSYLLEVLLPPVYYTRPEVDDAFARRPGIVQLLGARHESLPEAVALLPRYGFSLSDFRLILVVLRNPYDLEVSRYHYLRAGHPWDDGPNQRLALTRDFTGFAANSSLGQQPLGRLESYFHRNGEIPPNLRIIRFESLETDIGQALSSIGIEDHADFPWRNQSRHDDHLSYYTGEAEEAVYRKYKWVFDAGFYERLTQRPTSRGGKVEPAYTVPLVGPVRQEGRAAGFAPDCWVDAGGLRVTVTVEEFISEVRLEAALPGAGDATETRLSLTIGHQETAATFPAGDVSWTVPCILRPDDKQELRLKSSIASSSSNDGASRDRRQPALLLKRVAFIPDDARNEEAYRQLMDRIRQLVADKVPPKATILVLSKGDDELLKLDGHRAWHFPETDDAVYAGHHPANSEEAVTQLETQRTAGGEFLLFPKPSLWWLDYYEGLRQHLEGRYRAIVRQEDTCTIFSLAEGGE